MQDVNLKEQLNGLLKLQLVDSEMNSLLQEKKNIPLKLKEIDESFAKKKENLAQLEKRKLDLQRQRKEKELDFGTREEQARKMQTQLYQIKTNKEYSAKLKEIEGAKADMSAMEDVILSLFAETDTIISEIDKEKQFLAEEEKEINTQKQKLDLRGKEVEDKLSTLRARRNQDAGQVNAKILAQYERILKNSDYLGIAKVENNACQGCFMKVSPQVINLIKMYDKLVVCEVCQRILFIEDEGIGNLY